MKWIYNESFIFIFRSSILILHKEWISFNFYQLTIKFIILNFVSHLFFGLIVNIIICLLLWKIVSIKIFSVYLLYFLWFLWNFYFLIIFVIYLIELTLSIIKIDKTAVSLIKTNILSKVYLIFSRFRFFINLL